MQGAIIGDNAVTAFEEARTEDPAAAAAIVHAVLAYEETGEEDREAVAVIGRALWAILRNEADRVLELRAGKSAARAAAGRKGGKQTQANRSKSKQTEAKASKPEQTEGKASVEREREREYITPRGRGRVCEAQEADDNKAEAVPPPPFTLEQVREACGRVGCPVTEAESFLAWADLRHYYWNPGDREPMTLRNLASALTRWKIRAPEFKARRESATRNNQPQGYLKPSEEEIEQWEQMTQN